MFLQINNVVVKQNSTNENSCKKCDFFRVQHRMYVVIPRGQNRKSYQQLLLARMSFSISKTHAHTFTQKFTCFVPLANGSRSKCLYGCVCVLPANVYAFPAYRPCGRVLIWSVSIWEDGTRGGKTEPELSPNSLSVSKLFLL